MRFSHSARYGMYVNAITESTEKSIYNAEIHQIKRNLHNIPTTIFCPENVI